MALSHTRLTLATLQNRLLMAVRYRLSNGEYTERSLARHIGVSQPHVHNVLKGVRGLSTEVGDALLRGLDFSLVDLIETNELGLALAQRRPRDRATQMVPVLRGRLGPDSPFPNWDDVAEWFPMPGALFENANRLALVAVGKDAELGQAFGRVDYALLSRDESFRASVVGRHWYAIQWGGTGLIRQLRAENERLVILGQTTLSGRVGPSFVELNDCPQLRIVRAIVLWAGRDPRMIRGLRRWT
ncbi:hypothetical protein [uncultured Paludibaculum sp.]|uniref:hypothetical protein n=1 Tax=uncultured Paludibaculum sp. TaxID=1765020 RepID=UPI002AAB7C3A|nr:hypothetical protein [uncultured Paludibaculum sp.]